MELLVEKKTAGRAFNSLQFKVLFQVIKISSMLYYSIASVFPLTTFYLPFTQCKIFYLSKTLPLPIPCIASLSPSKTLMKFFGVTSYSKKILSYKKQQ